jgi:hypothetical protein
MPDRSSHLLRYLIKARQIQGLGIPLILVF